MGLKLHENPRDQEPCQTPKSEYEQSREERIRQNLEKMKKLGIVELSLGLKRNVGPLQPRRQAKNNLKTHPSVSPLLRSSQPSRRSSRLKNTSPVMYSEVELSKKKKAPLFDDEDFIAESSRPEIYNEEHFKLLRSTEKSWTLFVDGYGSDGKRIYDPVNGKTCHQCRQKTLGHRTHCIECNKVQGQFCGDCLYIRYGEHVLEANENPDWICPVCRGICNCSLCRQAKGWAPTGPLYKKITRLGFKSVAHYLIQTRRSEANNDTTANEVSAKRSLAFLEQLEVKSDDDDDKDSSKGPLGAESVGNVSKSFSRVVTPLDKEMAQQSLARKPNSDSGNEKQKEPVSYTPPKTTPKHKQKLDLVRVPGPESISGRLRHKTSVDVEPEKHKEKFLSDGDCCTTPLEEATPKLKRKLALVSVPVPGGDSIGGRLRQRRKDLIPVEVVSSESSESIQTPLKDSTPQLNLKRALVVVPSGDSIGGRLRQKRKDSNPVEVVSSESSESMIKTPLKGSTPKLNLTSALVVVPSGDSIGGRLRQRRMDSTPVKVVSSESSESIQTLLKKTPKLNLKRALVVVPSPDSIGGRLRLRRKMSDV